MSLFRSTFFRPVLFAVRTIRTHKARTALALLGVVVGVFAVVVIMSLGDGVKGYVTGLVETFGTDLIQIEVKVPNTGKTSTENSGGIAQGIQITTLTLDDEERVDRLPNVLASYAGSIAQERATYGSVGKRVMLFGAGAGAPLVDSNLKLESGRFYSSEEDESLSRVIVLGYGVKRSFFGDRDAVGESVTISGERYRVIGTLGKRGSAAFFDLDAMAYVPIRTLQKKLLGVDYVQMISVRMEDPGREEETVDLITRLLRKEHDIEDPSRDDFAVTSTKEAQKTLGDVVGTISILLVALTSISLIVGGVGIMNVMYVSVAERTGEIGLRKAVGAKSRDVLSQFLVEAVIVTGLGGLIGIALGVAFTWASSLALGRAGFSVPLVLTPRSLLLGAGFSVAVGVLFGLSPAVRASRLSPMEALRKE
ncbi:MAG: FtsX-like permease family protein [Candidatus Moranbacteria bacterium]|nr:FtsX-like permease family protein [Candidatus Moranbacteria bacterium]NTW45761.1 FtsX-like permease family protein [Candidatus Moranbacteria bacterium]